MQLDFVVDLPRLLPKLTGTFALNWDPLSDDGPIVAFNNLQLEAQGLVGNTLGSIVEHLEPVLRPAERVLDTLKKELPILNKLGVHVSARSIIHETSQLDALPDNVTCCIMDLTRTRVLDSMMS